MAKRKPLTKEEKEAGINYAPAPRSDFRNQKERPEVSAAKEYVPYWRKLQDPRWQKMRLEVMHRDEFKCCICFDSETTLHVHHGYYEKDKEPWDYEFSTLWTICEDCHGYIQDQLRDIHYEIAKLWPYMFNYLMADIQRLHGENPSQADLRQELDATPPSEWMHILRRSKPRKEE